MTSPIIVDGRVMTVAEFESAHGLHGGGALDLRGTSITALPDGLHVGGWLFLSYTSITALPEGLHVGGALDLSDTGITALPEGLHVGGSLFLRGTSIIPVGKDSRDYEFFAVRLASGPRVIAGCRNFSPAQARDHWPEGSECRALAEKCIAALEAESAS